MDQFLSSYKLGNLEVGPGLVLAPMSGVTCSAFRRLIKELNPGAVGMVVSEFISVEGLTRGSERSVQMMRFVPEERPFCIQIFGHDIDRICRAAEMAQEAGADVVDLNAGCPAPKVVKRGGGCELMRQPKHLEELLRRLRGVVTCPLTIKMRSGWSDESLNCFEISRIAEQAGLDGIAIHPRTRIQLYRGEADWKIIEEVSSELSIPVIGSGDVLDRLSARERWGAGVDGLMIGRAAMKNPFVFSEIVSGESRGLSDSPTMMVEILLRYVELLREEFVDRSCVGRLKQLASQMCKGQSWAKDLCRLNSLEEQLVLLFGEVEKWN